MANIYKRFVGKVIVLRSDLFAWARIKLTALYLFIVILILTVFSLVLYVNVAQRLGRDFTKRPGFSVNRYEESPVDTALEKFSTGILSGDLIVLIIAGSLCYWLAGYTLRPIRKSLEAQAQFSAEASHELRTPLAVIRTDIEVLLKSKGQLSDEVKATLQSNLEEVNSLSDLADDLLLLSRGGDPVLKTRKRWNLKSLIHELVERFSSLAKERGIELTQDGVENVEIIGDKQELARAFGNLIINSLNNTPAGGSIKISVSIEDNRALLTVRDTGIGIPVKDLERIFEPFYKVHRINSSQDFNYQKSTGLGLALVKKIIEQHRGSIKIGSIEGQGTTIAIRLPLA